MKKVVVVTPPVNEELLKAFDFSGFDLIVGVDRAVELLKKTSIKIDIAVGDFDSLDHMEMLEDITVVVKLAEIKDHTDTYEAVNYVIEKGYTNVLLLGGVGGARVEHTLANIWLLYQFPKLVIETNKSTIYRINEGVHKIAKGKDYYINIFPLFDETLISLKGFKYNLNKEKLNVGNSLGISNEVSDDYGEIQVHKNSVVIIKTIKDN